MKALDDLIPWIVIALGVVFFTFGLWGFIGGLIMIIGTMVYFYKNNRGLALKIMFSIIAVLIATTILLVVINTPVNFTTTKP